MDKIVRTYRQRETVDKYAYLATYEEIKENDFNLNIPRYVDTFEPEPDIDIEATQSEIQQLEGQLADVQHKLRGYLQELGFCG